MKYGQHFSTVSTPQTEQAPNKTQVQNSAGGFVFEVSDWTRLDRFLVLGSEKGSYYATEKKLTVENAQCVLRCFDENAKRAVDRIVEISHAGRAPKNDQAVFALAMASGHPKAKHFVTNALPKVCRIGTHIFQFAEAGQSFRGWGRGLRTAVAKWYTDKDVKDLAYQCVKYQQREGWSHRDLLRLCHAKPSDSTNSKANAFVDHITVLNWIVKGWNSVGDVPHDRDALKIIWAFEKAKRSTDKKEIARLITDYNLPRECVPTQFLTEPSVWEALLEKMPMMAMIRNLATMTRIGLIVPLSKASRKVCDELKDTDKLKKSRIHPIAVLLALRTYASGHGDKSKNTWVPVPQVVDALNEAFYASFANVEPTGKRWLFGVDVSGSMSSPITGTTLSCREAAAALAMVTAHTERDYFIHGFSDRFIPLPISRGMRLDDVLRITANLPFERTDCSLPMLYAKDNKLDVDVFVVITDNETYANPTIHPFQALGEYRRKTGINAKLAVVGMTASEFSIADSSDPYMMDVVGMDTNVPQILSDFARA